MIDWQQIIAGAVPILLGFLIYLIKKLLHDVNGVGKLTRETKEEIMKEIRKTNERLAFMEGWQSRGAKRSSKLEKSL